ncbi:MULTISPECIES: TetR/AcrR family transcriptional regulator [Kribbella]|uniref:TetR/AcrR family transcriptional regulator n=1 Tax=Kribbella karoonensis TaxID=324851 RepID=A0ABP4PVN3_9ACTN
MSTAAPDRRTRRRQATIAEILDVAIELMSSEGVAALSLSAVARRLGMQPPSLYQYFPSKKAIYDALFQRGSELQRDAYREALAGATTDDPRELSLVAATAFCRWCLENQVYAQLMFWRTVPGFEPSPAAYAPAQETLQDLREHLKAMAEAGYLHPEAASDEGVALYTSLTAGLLSQQMANEPDVSFDDGRFIRMLPTVLEMFYQHYAPTRGKR